MIASFYGYVVDLSQLRERFAVSQRGLTLKGIIDIASRLNLASRAIKLEFSSLSSVQLPAILHWRGYHFVVLKKFGKRSVIHDPAVGEVVLGTDELRNGFTGVALELSPTSEFTPVEVKRRFGIRQLWSRAIGLKRSITQVVLLSLVMQVIAAASPLFVQKLLDDIVRRHDTSLLVVLAFGFSLLVIAECGIRILRGMIVIALSSRLNVQMSANVFRHLIRLPMMYFVKRQLGDVVSRFSSLSNIRELLTTSVVSAVLDGLMAILMLLILLGYSITLTGIVMATILMYLAIRLSTYRRMRTLVEESVLLRARESSHFIESVRAFQTVKLFQLENARTSGWMNLLVRSINKQMQVDKWGLGFDVMSILLFGVENIVLLVLAGLAVMDGSMTVGMVFAYVAYKTRFMDATRGLIERGIEMRMISVHLDRLADIALTRAEPSDDGLDAADIDASGHRPSKADASTDGIAGRINVNELEFRYGESEPIVFSNLSFTIAPGETVVITGPSGCGKTTLIKCLLGLLEPTGGEILIDGIALRKVKGYRSQVAGIMQEDGLLVGTLAENIAAFAEEIDAERVKECAQLACIHEDIMRMTMHYNTYVNELGSGMSAGQQQRVIVARALYRRPRILFMDEATSHLDVSNERILSQNIRSLSMTRVMIAHRPETIRSADREIRMEFPKLGRTRSDSDVNRPVLSGASSS